MKLIFHVIEIEIEIEKHLIYMIFFMYKVFFKFSSTLINLICMYIRTLLTEGEKVGWSS